MKMRKSLIGSALGLTVLAGTALSGGVAMASMDDPATGRNPLGLQPGIDVSISAIAATTTGGRAFSIFTSTSSVPFLPSTDWIALSANTTSCNVQNTNTGSYNSDSTMTGTPPPHWYQAWDGSLPPASGGIPDPYPTDPTVPTVLWGARHPYININTYRINSEGRLEQLSAGWTKHGWYAASASQGTVSGPNGQPRCGDTGFSCSGPSDNFLGANCSDTYSSGHNSDRQWLGPRSEISARGSWHTTGWDMRDSWLTRASFNGATDNYNASAPSPTFTRSYTGSGTAQAWKLNQLSLTEIGPSGLGTTTPSSLNNNTGNLGRVFIEGYYVVNSDNYKFNNIASRRWTIAHSGSGGATSATNWGMNGPHLFGPTILQWNSPSIHWNNVNDAPPPGVFRMGVAQPQSEGQVYIASRVVDLGNGTFRYEYNVFNLDFDREVDSFSIPVPNDVVISGVGFWQPRQIVPGYHGWSLSNPQSHITTINTPSDPTRWNWSLDTANRRLVFSPPTPSGLYAGQLPNTIRWGTMYTFWFTSPNRPLNTSSAAVTGRLPGVHTSMVATPISTPRSFADIAQTDSSPGADGTVDNGDFSLFISSFFSAECSATCGVSPVVACGPADIAQTDASPGADGCVDNGDFSLFINAFFSF
jgi:hypothetical protein